MLPRRDFLARTAGTLGALALAPSAFAAAHETARTLGARLDTALARRGPVAVPARLAADEAFWAEVRQAYDLAPDVVNLDHGWTNPAPRVAMDDLDAHARRLEALPAERLWTFWEEVTNTTARTAVAEVMGVPGDQIALVRNATEALDTVLLGVPLERGDEVVCSAHDYYAMLDALEQRQARSGIVLHMVRPPIPAPSLGALAELYEATIGPKTRLVLLTHPSNLTGQMLPVRRIAEAAHAVGAEVVVDGAQALGLLGGGRGRPRGGLLRREPAQVARRARRDGRAVDAAGALGQGVAARAVAALGRGHGEVRVDRDGSGVRRAGRAAGDGPPRIARPGEEGGAAPLPGRVLARARRRGPP